MNAIDITFQSESPRCDWLGRNGQFVASGVSLTRTSAETIMIEPRGKRGTIGRCLIEFPLSAIPQITEFLNKQTN